MADLVKQPRYVADIPYSVRRSLCQMLDVDKGWEDLAGELQYDVTKIQLLNNVYLQQNGSPTNNLLTDWGTRNPTIVKLFQILAKLHRIREMTLLKALVPSQYHSYLPSDDQDSSDVVFTGGKCPTQLEEIDTNELPKPDEDDYLTFEPNKLSSDKIAKHSAESPQHNYQNIPHYPSDLDNSGCRMANGPQYDQRHEELVYVRKEASPISDMVRYREPDEGDEGMGHTNTYVSHVAKENTDAPEPIYDKEAQLAHASTQHFEYKRISQATSGFDDSYLIGEGGYGKVYKGTICKTVFAIKVLAQKEDYTGEEERKRQHREEVKALMYYRHENILPLSAISNDGPALCLVYQYMVNGSLEDRLMCKENSKPLDWKRRVDIALGAARGLQYLHTADEKPLIHGDMKSANILLDKHFEAKIGDFGVSKTANKGTETGKYTHVTMKDKNLYFTLAYTAPEVARSGGYSIKGDTFAFGVVLYEICTGERAVDEKREGGERFLKDRLSNILDDDKITDDELYNLHDKKAGDWPRECFKEILMVGKRSASERKKARPEMPEVLSLLEDVKRNYQKKKVEGFDRGSFYQSDQRSNSPRSFQVNHSSTSYSGDGDKAVNSYVNQQIVNQLSKDNSFDDPKFLISDPKKEKALQEDYNEPASDCQKDIETVDGNFSYDQSKLDEDHKTPVGGFNPQGLPVDVKPIEIQMHYDALQTQKTRLPLDRQMTAPVEPTQPRSSTHVESLHSLPAQFKSALPHGYCEVREGSGLVRTTEGGAGDHLQVSHPQPQCQNELDLQTTCQDVTVLQTQSQSGTDLQAQGRNGADLQTQGQSGPESLGSLEVNLLKKKGKKLPGFLKDYKTEIDNLQKEVHQFDGMPQFGNNTDHPYYNEDCLKMAVSKQEGFTKADGQYDHAMNFNSDYKLYQHEDPQSGIRGELHQLHEENDHVVQNRDHSSRTSSQQFISKNVMQSDGGTTISECSQYSSQIITSSTHNNNNLTGLKEQQCRKNASDQNGDQMYPGEYV